MPSKATKPKPKLTDAERHKRFLAMAREVEADDSAESFDRAFKRVVSSKPVRAKGARPGK